ncbi:Hat1_N domain-containing protein [Meloidogyne graminicola]|uniref:Histone acetyltransferase type B catalytic subunit n=1 Tax=Meloidogyne graminicola TaxID=189291 RepID=A0A8S9ZIQ3_9BILA|nr:Hat1_N domain-containing protein [Meloidogyne graminicola]
MSLTNCRLFPFAFDKMLLYSKVGSLISLIRVLKLFILIRFITTNMQLESIAGNEDDEYVSDALLAVKLKFVSSTDDIDTSIPYSPEFAYQHFGENETIIGYKNLCVTVLYSDTSLYLTCLIKYDSVMNGNSSIQCDNIVEKIKDVLPSTQLDAYLPFDKFKDKLLEQKKFRPYGELISKFSIEQEIGKERCFELYKFDKSETDPRLEEGIKFLERAQSIAFWYIESVQYTDEEDPRFFNYFLFESLKSSNDGLSCWKFAGYANLYRFYHYPDKERIRIAQILLAPPFRKMGLGPKFLQSIYSDLWKINAVWDITAEVPAGSFVIMRDYTDVLNCSKLPQFSKENLLNGFNLEMYNSAREKYKLCKTQSRRVYEILRLFHTKVNIPEEIKQFKSDVLKRLKKLVMDPKRDSARIAQSFADDEQSLAIAMKAFEPEQQQYQLEMIYENLVNNYRTVLNLLAKYEKNFMNKNTSTRKPFGFPFDPYPIQRQLMNAIYNSAEQGHISIFESPTGTGKSLSTICAFLIYLYKIFNKNNSLTWLEENEKRHKEDVERRIRELSLSLQGFSF